MEHDCIIPIHKEDFHRTWLNNWNKFSQNSISFWISLTIMILMPILTSSCQFPSLQILFQPQISYTYVRQNVRIFLCN